MRKFLCLAVTAMLLIACSCAAFAGAPSDKILIGALAPLTGDAAQYGIAVKNGCNLAVEEINAAGGVLGKQIELILYDDRHDPTAATTGYDRLVNEDGVIALVGAVTTAPTIAAAQKAVADGIPMITPTGTGAAITQIGANIFRACFTDPYQGELMAHYSFEKMNAKTAAVLYDSGSDYSKGVAQAFEATAKALGITITASEAYPTDTTDFKAQLTKIKAGNPDVIMAPCYYGTAAMLISQARDLGITSKFTGPDGWDGLLNQIDKSNVKAINDSFYCTQYAFDAPSPKLAEVMKAYTEKFGTEYLNMFGMLGYEAMHMTAAAIKAAGSTDSAAIVEAMKKLEFDGLAGVISFKGSNDPVREAYIVEFVDGAETLKGSYAVPQK